MKGVFRKRNGCLYPADDDSREWFDKLPNEKDLLGEITSPRNIRQHRLFFALLKLLVENTESFASVDDALVAIKVSCGEVDTWIDPKSGKTYFIPRSIKFASMDGSRFTRLFERALHVICDRWLVGTGADELRQQVYALVDGDARASLGRRAA